MNVETTKKISDKCYLCGYGVYITGNISIVEARKMFEANDWSYDDYNRCICPECWDEE